MGEREVYNQLMIRLAKRLDRIEAQLIELSAFVGFVKDQAKQKEKQDDTKQALKDLEYNTAKDWARDNL